MINKLFHHTPHHKHTNGPPTARYVHGIHNAEKHEWKFRLYKANIIVMLKEKVVFMDKESDVYWNKTLMS